MEHSQGRKSVHVLVFFSTWVILLFVATVVLNFVGQYLRPHAAAEQQRAMRSTGPSNLVV